MAAASEARHNEPMQQARHIAALVLMGLVIVVAVQNVETANVRFLVWTFSAPRVLLLFAVFCAGAIVGWLAHRPKRYSANTHHTGT